MPTVLRIDGALVIIYPGDHEPAHVHVRDAGKEAIFILHCPDGPVTLRRAKGCTSADLRRYAAVLDEQVGHLCSAWEVLYADR